MIIALQGPLYQCILPFSECPYRVTSLGGGCGKRFYCDNIAVGPYNSDAGCWKVTWKKDMIISSRLATPLTGVKD